jgi:hypothetical protein
VDVLDKLDHLGVLLGRQVTVSRDARSRVIEIHAFGVPTVIRKSVMDMSRDLGTERQRHVVLRRDAPAAQPLARTRPTARLRDEAVYRGPIAADAELRRFLLSNGHGVDIDSATRTFANRVIDRSRQAVMEAGIIRDLLAAFSHDERASMDRQTSQQFGRLIQQHAHAVQQQTALLRLDLQPVFGLASLPETVFLSSSFDEEPRAIASRLFVLATRNDEAVRAGFALSSGHESVDGFLTGEVWTTLRETEDVATRLENRF